MEVNRLGSKIVIDLDKEEDAVGLFAVLSGNQAIDPAVLKHGHWLYTWFFTSVQKLSANYTGESSRSTMSAETLTGPPSIVRKSKKR